MPLTLVLDDVDCIEQLEALAGEPDWFKWGSRIIITTRDEQVLLAHRVNFVHDVNLLSSTEAICLFSRHAFQKEIPIRGYEELSGQVVQYADGLPLTIKVMGSFLCGQSERFWIDAIERLKTIPLKQTLEKLELSFDGLEKDYKEIFLDVACILKGWLKDEAIRALESRGFHAEVGLRVLEQKSLITISVSELGLRLGMHDHLEEMGRDVVRRLHPDEPNKHSRLWIGKEIEYLLTNDMGNEATKCLYFSPPDGIVEIAMKSVANMKDLRFIDVCNTINRKCDKDRQYLPNSLQFVKWYRFPFSSLPNTFQGKHLVGLEMCKSNIVQLWEDGEEKVLFKLRFLTMSYSNLRTFDLRVAPNLERLTIFECFNFAELHMPARHIKIKYLHLSVSKLTTLNLEVFPNVETLILRMCSNLVELQMPVENLKLENLDLSFTQLKTIHLENTPNLETLFLKGCHSLVELQMPIENLKLKHLDLSYSSQLKIIHLGYTPNLEKLVLANCWNLVELQMPIENLKLKHLDLDYSSQLKTIHLGYTPNLEKLVLAHSKLKTIHLGNTPNLETLRLEGCNDLVELQMPVVMLKLEELNLSLSHLKTIHLGNTPNLERLVLLGCNDLVELQMPVKNLKLKYLDLSYSSQLKTIHIGNTPNLETLIRRRCNDLVELQKPGKNLKLENLDLSYTQLKTIHLEKNLETLLLRGCNSLVELQMPVENLKLKHLDLSDKQFKTFHLGYTPNLERLVLAGCKDLLELQMPIENLKLKYLNLAHSKLKTIHLGNTPNLETLILEGCNDLVELKIPVVCLKLEYVDLRYSQLKTVHLGNTPNIKTLILQGCNDLVELQMPVVMLKLEELDLSHSHLKTIHLGNTPNIKTLILGGCNDLVELQMPVVMLKLKALDLSHSKLSTLDLGLTPNLKMLNLKNCYSLVDINAPVGCLQNLAALDVSGCGSFESFWFDKQLDSLEVGSLSELHLIAEPADVCPLHSDNDSPKFQFSCYYKEDPDASFGNLERLIYIGLCACANLQGFSRNICSLQCIRKLTLEGGITEAPRDLDQLEYLEKLTFSSTNIRNLPDSICKMKHLKSLELRSCLLLEKLPADLGQIESLETLIISECNLLRDIPNNIGKIKCILSPKVYKRFTHGKFKQLP